MSEFRKYLPTSVCHCKLVASSIRYVYCNATLNERSYERVYSIVDYMEQLFVVVRMLWYDIDGSVMVWQVYPDHSLTNLS